MANDVTYNVCGVANPFYVYIQSMDTHTTVLFQERKRVCVCVFVVLRTETLLHMYVHTYIRSVRIYMYVYVYVCICKPEATRDCVNTSSLQLCIIAGIFQNCLVYQRTLRLVGLTACTHRTHTRTHTHTHTRFVHRVS